MKMKNSLTTLGACLLMTGAGQGATVVYSDTFDNDGLATNTGTGGGMVNRSIAGTKSWTDDGKLQFVTGTGTQFEQRAMVYSSNGFQSDGGFELAVSYFYTSNAGASGISFGLVSDDTNFSTYTGFNPFSTNTSVYSFGANADNNRLVFTNATTASTLDTGTLMGPGAGNFTVAMSITSDGLGGANWSWSTGGVSRGSGNITAFDFSKTFHFVAYGQDDQGNKGINSVSLSTIPIPEPSSFALLLGGLGFLVMRRHRK